MISDLLGTTVEGVHRLLGALGVPTVHFPGHGDERYVLTYALESTLFALGMPKAIKERPDMIRLHQELAGVLYGTLTKEALRERVAGLIKTLTSDAKKPKMKRVKGNQKTWAGRTPS